jgi:SAM-dependent methyltransferase
VRSSATLWSAGLAGPAFPDDPGRMSAFAHRIIGCSSSCSASSLRFQSAMTTSSVDVPSTTGRVLHWAAQYDVLVWLLTHGRPRAFRRTLAALARLAPGESVLDIGCGTGSLAIEVKRQVGPTGTVIGVDASPEMIARARWKALRARVDVTFHHAVAEALPFPTCSLMSC